MPPGSKGRAPQALLYAGFGVEFAVTIVATLMLGYKIDEYFGTAPFLMLVLIAAGMFGAIQRLLWSLKKHSSTSNPS